MESQQLCLFFIAFLGLVSARLPWGENGDAKFPVWNLPEQTWNHYDGDDNYGLEGPASTQFGREMLVSGGISLEKTRRDVYAYNLGYGNWTYYPDKLEDMFAGRAFHTAEIYRDYHFLYGGVERGIEIQQLHGGMEHLVYNGPGPRRRVGHSSLIYDEEMYIYGGYTDKGEFTAELWRADLRFGEIYWELLDMEAAPGPRVAHSAILYQDSMYIYGGENNNGVLPDLWRYDFLTHKWVRVFDWTDCDATAGVEMPPEREGHVATFWADEGMYIWGGWNTKNGFLNDMWRFDLQKEEWTQIFQGSDVAGYKTDSFSIPSPRAFFAHSVVDSKLVVTGGQVGMAGVDKVFWSPKTRFVPINSDDAFAGDVWEFNFCTKTWEFINCLPPWGNVEITTPLACRSNFEPQCENDCNGNGVCVRDDVCICRGEWKGKYCTENICASAKYLGYSVDLMDRILVVESILKMGKNLRRLKEKLEFVQERLPPFEEFTSCIKFNPLIAELVREQASTDGLSFNMDVETSLIPVVEEFNQILEDDSIIEVK